MSWISRCIVAIGSAFALAIALASPVPAIAGASLTATLGSRTIHFTTLSSAMGGPAIAVEDPGFKALMDATGSLLTWRPGRRYVLITTGAPTVISFAVGDRHYDVGPLVSEAPFAPYRVGRDVFVPLGALLHALGLALLHDAQGAVLQPQLYALHVKNDGTQVRMVARASVPLHPRLEVGTTPGVLTYVFAGVGTSIAGTRSIGAGGVRSVTVAARGSVRDPETIVRVRLEPGTTHGVPGSNDGRDAVLTFAGGPGAPEPEVAQIVASPAPPGSAAPAPVAPSGVPASPAGPATVTGVQFTSDANGATLTIAVSGNADYAWHRLRAPDNRFWVDISGAQLDGPPIAESAPSPLGAIRVRQNDPDTVRVAISLPGQQALDVSPSATGLTIAVGNQVVADAPSAGNGTLGSVVSVAEAAAPVTPAPYGEQGSAFGAAWKFGGSASTYVPTNPKLIVIDPGHGGSDRGAVRHGTAEATLTLDMAKRLQTILEARGWQVQLTHNTDRDVYKPNDSARDELQARDDIANEAGARMLVSIHCNAYINAGPDGTTIYYAKRSDVPLADAIDQDIGPMLGTRDDGIVKSRLYIPLHALMPSVLIETAFLSNPHDYALLISPSWRQKVAEWIADGIDRYAQNNPVAGQPAQ